MATIRDVARKAGVSSSTVSLTFSNSGRVSAEKAERIWAAAKELNYRPNPLAQSLKRGRTNLIGIVIADLLNPFCGLMLKEIERIAKQGGYSVLVAESDCDTGEELAILERFEAQKVAGVLLFPHGSGEDYVSQLNAQQLPIVMVDQKVDGADLDAVYSDNRLAASMLTEHLLRLGHRKIAHISGADRLWTAKERIAGFEHSMRSAGVETCEIVDGNYLYDQAYSCAMALLTRSEPPTAILAANNVMALGTLAAIQDLGFKCPEEISLATVDDVPWSAVIKPKLTLVAQDQASIARAAMNYLIERIEGKVTATTPARETVLAPQLSIGHSTHAPAQS